jgi:hypothetical protein
MESETLDMFPTLVSMVQDTDNPVLPMDIKSCLVDHLIMLKVHFENTFAMILMNIVSFQYIIWLIASVKTNFYCRPNIVIL